MKLSFNIAVTLLTCIGCMVIVVAVWLIWEPTFIMNDGVQYLSTAFNWLAGQGLSTNALVFTPHFQGSIPAPQTIWPPGYPLLVSLTSMLGLPLLTAALLVNLFTHALGALVMYLIFIRQGVKFLPALGFSVMFFLTAGQWTYIVGLVSEPVFNLCIVTTLLLLPNPKDERVWPWIASGLFIGLCVSIRYLGVLFAVGIGLGMFVYCLFRLRFERRNFIRCLGLMALQQSIAIAIFTVLQYRTFSLIGTLRRQAGIEEPESVKATFLDFTWQLRELVGFSDNGIIPPPVGKLLLIIMIITFLFVFFYSLYWCFTKNAENSVTDNDSARILKYAILAHTIVFVAFFAVSTMGSNNIGITHRYLFQIYSGLYLLFCLLIWKAFKRMNETSNARARSLYSVALAVLFGLFFVAQVNTATAIQDAAIFGKNTRAILALDVAEGITLHKMIDGCYSDSTTNAGGGGTGTLWSNDGQMFHVHTGVPTLTTAKVYANEPFDLDQMAEKIQTYNVKMLIFVNGLGDTQPQFIQLMSDFKQWLVRAGHTQQPMLETQISGAISANVFVVDQNCFVTG